MKAATFAAVAILVLAVGNGHAVPLNPEVGMVVTSVPTPGVPGFVTNTLTFSILSNPTDFIVGFDGAFIGPMNQVNPFTQPTIYQDNNVMFGFIGADVKQDSQFLFKTTTADAVNGVLTVGGAESGTLLDGSFALNRQRLNPNAGNSVAIVQLAVPAGTDMSTMIEPAGVLLVRDVKDVARTVLIIPEPATMSLLVLGAAAMLWRRRS